MIFYGSKASLIKEGRLNNVKCPNCEDGQTMNYGIYGKYAYIYWIPLFPIGKANVLECDSCKRTYKLKELPNQIKQKFETEKTGAGFPLWYFSGLAVIAILIAWFSYSNKKDSENSKLFIETPAIGDVYKIKSGAAGFYTTMKATRITSDSVFVIINDYEIERKSNVYKIDKDENYNTRTDGYSKQELKHLFEKEIIFGINRD